MGKKTILLNWNNETAEIRIVIPKEHFDLQDIDRINDVFKKKRWFK